MTRQHMTRAALAAALAVGLTACEQSPVGPTSDLTPVRLTVSGPEELAPGQSAQFRALLHRGDGSVDDVTSTATWSVGYPDVAIVAASGRVTAFTPGEIVVRASFSAVPSLNASANLLVLEPGTYVLTVRVFARDAPGEPVFPATVEATTATGQKRSGKWSETGYRLYGLSGSTELRTSYQRPYFLEPDVRTIDVVGHEEIDVLLATATTTRPDVSGTYTLTITASASCADELPAETRVRRYKADVVQRPTGDVVVTLDDAQFEFIYGAVRNSIAGRVVDPGYLSLEINDYRIWDIPEHFVVEKLTDPERTYIPTGTLNAPIEPTRISGRLTGTLWVHTPPQAVSVRCGQADHDFTLVRR